MDIWGNAKISDLSSVVVSEIFSHCGWYDASSTSLIYSSLIGIPVQASFSPTSNTTFSMRSSYLQLDCALLQMESQSGNHSVDVNLGDDCANITNWTSWTY